MKISVRVESGKLVCEDLVTKTNTTSEATSGSAFSSTLEKAKDTSDSSSTGSLTTVTKYDSIFKEASAKYGIPYSLLTAVAKQESNFRADAVSKSGARGVMQLMPSTAKTLGVKNTLDPYDNIMGGAKYLSQLWNKYGGDVKKTVAAYNSGPGAVDRCGGVPSKSAKYVSKVIGYMDTGVSVPAVNYVKSDATKQQLAADVEKLLADFDEHQSYEEFVARMQQQMMAEAGSADDVTDAYAAYAKLLGNANTVIQQMLAEI